MNQRDEQAKTLGPRHYLGALLVGAVLGLGTAAATGGEPAAIPDDVNAAQERPAPAYARVPGESGP